MTTARRLLFDCEADGLLDTVTKLHCIAAVDIDTGEPWVWGHSRIPEALDALSTADVLVAHHGLGYDFPVLKKLHSFEPKAVKRDTLVIAKLIHPDLRRTDTRLVTAGKLPAKLHGSHSLEAWGYRLGRPKLHADIKDWSEWTAEIQERCVGDIQTNLALWHHLKPDAYSQAAIELEHRVRELCNLMTETGWPFDEKAAQLLHIELAGKHHVLKQELVAEFGSWWEPKKEKDGCPEVFVPKRDNKRLGYIKDAPCTQIELVTFNPSSRDHIIRCLKALGWEPESFTDNGNPKLDDEILEDLSARFPSGTKLVEYLLLNKRIGQIATGEKAWLKQVKADGRVHGSYDPMGTTTSRACHFGPNLGQVPAGKSPYGKECRSLFTVPKGWVMVGADQQGLQLRNLGHYLAPLDGGEYGRIVTTQDPHWAHALALGLAVGEREKDNELHEIVREAGAKRFIYAYLFGAFDKKLGSVIRDACTTARTRGWPEVFDQFRLGSRNNAYVGSEARDKFDKRFNVATLLEKLSFIRRSVDPKTGKPAGYLYGLDGRWVPCEADRLALNYLLMSCEAVICKTWIVNAYDELLRLGYRFGWDGDFVFLGWIHDELQVACRQGLEEEIGAVLVTQARKAGAAYGYRVPLDSGFKVGGTWADTH